MWLDSQVSPAQNINFKLLGFYFKKLILDESKKYPDPIHNDERDWERNKLGMKKCKRWYHNINVRSTDIDKGGTMDMGASTPNTWVQDLPGGRKESNIQGLLLVHYSEITPNCPWGTNWCDTHSFLFSGQIFSFLNFAFFLLPLVISLIRNTSVKVLNATNLDNMNKWPVYLNMTSLCRHLHK